MLTKPTTNIDSANMDPYTKLADYLSRSSKDAPPTREGLQPHIDSIRFGLHPEPGALAVLWPGITQVLADGALSTDAIAALVDDLIKPMTAAKVVAWDEIKATVGPAENLIATARSGAHTKVIEASMAFLSNYDFSEGAEKGITVVRDLVALLSLEQLKEGVVAALERTLEQFLTNYPGARPVLIGAALEIKTANPSSAVIVSRIQDLTLKIIDSSGHGIDDIPDTLLKYVVKQDDVLAELMTMQFYESLLDLYLPPLIFLQTRQEYFDIAEIYKSPDALGLEKSAAARTLGRLSQVRGELFAEIDAGLGIVKNLTLRDDTDRTMLALIPGDYVAQKNSQLIRTFPVSSASLLPILCNWCSSYDALEILQLSTSKLTKLQIPELLTVGKALAMSQAGTKVLATMPGVLEILLTRSGRAGYELMRLRGDIVDALADDANYEILGEYWYHKVCSEKARGHWGEEDYSEPKVEVMDSAA